MSRGNLQLREGSRQYGFARFNGREGLPKGSRGLSPYAANLGFRVLGLGILVSGCGFRVHSSRLRDFGLRVPWNEVGMAPLEGSRGRDLAGTFRVPRLREQYVRFPDRISEEL